MIQMNTREIFETKKRIHTNLNAKLANAETLKSISPWKPPLLLYRSGRSERVGKRTRQRRVAFLEAAKNNATHWPTVIFNTAGVT